MYRDTRSRHNMFDQNTLNVRTQVNIKTCKLVTVFFILDVKHC